MACPSGRFRPSLGKNVKCAQALHPFPATWSRDSSMHPRWKWVLLDIFLQWRTSFYARLTPALSQLTRWMRVQGIIVGQRSYQKLQKSFNIGTNEATKLFNCIVRDTAIDINAEKLKCAEDCGICWTTFQNLDLWFHSWEVFVVEYDFATINMNGELIFDKKVKNRIANLDETCLSLDGSNSNRGGQPTVAYYNVRFP